jgi:hypothetical protein
MAGPSRWIPLLVLNGTSTETGRRIITSTLSPYVVRATAGTGGERIFRDSYDYYETRCEPHAADCACGGDRAIPPQCDLRVSTAVLNSARFPVISPRGNLRDANGQIIDRIIDGGLFGN